ncbi:DUF3842 family protein [Zhaonella formicivorans]|uniref:DUF3842 family protein n=1 Tax=Zhaonella formicivorans TaxID=2528593 RepID=UPI0010EBC433|nr:DUF3842 family protein [Zhaonella formicivorans]
MKIAIIDGQGGGIGKNLTEKIRQELGDKIEIIALGTNALATSAMLKAGANDGASGENAIVQNVKNVQIIVGTISILVANSMLGELTPAMAKAIGESPALKIILPINRSNIEIIGVKGEPLPHHVEQLVARLKQLIVGENNV